MKVFISWSGERSQILAQALREWLPMVLQSVDPWLSQADIEAGERWAEKIAKELEGCNFGILSP
jgi:TIR domain